MPCCCLHGTPGAPPPPPPSLPPRPPRRQALWFLAAGTSSRRCRLAHASVHRSRRCMGLPFEAEVRSRRRGCHATAGAETDAHRAHGASWWRRQQRQRGRQAHQIPHQSACAWRCRSFPQRPPQPPPPCAGSGCCCPSRELPRSWSPPGRGLT